MQSFGIEFKNLKFEIYMPVKNESRFDLFANEISVERTAIIKENFRANLPMMIIERKFIQPKNQSIILIEQENDFNSLQTANVTLVFHHRVRRMVISHFEIPSFVLVIGNSLSMSGLSFHRCLVRSEVELIFIPF